MSTTSSSTPKAIFSPTKIGSHTLKHRVVLAPLTRYRATYENIPTDLQVEYYRQRATEGGLMITEATFIHPTASPFKHVPGVWSKEQIEGWKKVTSAVHEKKAIFYNQLWHVGRAGFRNLNPNNEQIVSASDIPISGKHRSGADYEVPRPLEIDEIKEVVNQFRQAALNSIEAGFDGVEIHGANGYLIDQFLNSSSNKRTDIYGGSIENRARFALEVIEAVAGAIGPERAAIRFSPGENYQDMEDDTTEETWSYVISEIQKRIPSLSYIHLVQARSAVHTNDQSIAPPNTLDPYRNIWKGPLIAASGFSTSTDYAIDLAEKTGNLVAFGRAFIANPDLPKRLLHGLELNKYNRATFYNHDAIGYTDYPFYEDTHKN